MSRMPLRKAIMKLGLTAVGVNKRLSVGSLDFRSKQPRKRPVALLWTAGCSADDPKVHDAIKSFAEHAEIVLVIDDLAFQSASILGCFVETLPSQSDRSKLTTLDWTRYVSNRIDRIQRSWNPDMVVNVGESIDVFLERFGASVEPTQPLPTIEDIEREMRPG